jgi:hypothetical protein
MVLSSVSTWYKGEDRRNEGITADRNEMGMPKLIVYPQ